MSDEAEEEVIITAIDRIADRIEDDITEESERLGISADEIIDRVANELKARQLYIS